MKKVIAIFIVAIGTLVSSHAQDDAVKHNKMSADKTQLIVLEQIPGEFTQKQLTVKSGTYVFEIFNNEVGHDVGFVLVEKGKDLTKQENHIQTAYVTQAVANGARQRSNPTVLQPGEYMYFCPLNPTATDNTLIVE